MFGEMIIPDNKRLHILFDVEEDIDTGQMAFKLSDVHQQMIFSAFRYALGRHTYIVRTTADFLCDIMPLLGTHWCELMVREITEYMDGHIDDHEVMVAHDCDIRAWNQVLCSAKHEVDLRGKL